MTQDSIVHEAWLDIVGEFSISEEDAASIYQIIENYYNEDTRYYHTLTHIHDLLVLFHQFNSIITQKSVVFLSIIFHDIIYNPKAADNEEKSAELFQTLMTSFLPIDIITIVLDFIIATKSHQLSSNNINLKLFLDFDMSIFSTDRSIYIKYANSIRNEYIHVDFEVYCVKRSEFLRSMLLPSYQIYHSEYFKENEMKAKDNILYEIQFLEKLTLPH